MRALLLLAVTTMVTANCKAQDPFAVDTNVRFFYTPVYIDQWTSHYMNLSPSGCWSWQPTIATIHARNDGTILLTGPYLKKVEETPWGPPQAIAMNPDGSLGYYLITQIGGGRTAVIPGSDQYTSGSVIFNHDGSVDHSFRGMPTGMTGLLNWPSIVFDGRKMLKPGHFIFQGYNTTLIKTDSVGELDPSFTSPMVNGYGSAIPLAVSIRQLRNGQYLLNGHWTQIDGHPAGSLARLWPDGSLDTSFFFPCAKSVVDNMLEQDNGQLILGGRLYFDIDTLHLIRINLNGTIDSTFNNRNEFRYGVSTVANMWSSLRVLHPLNDGRIIVGGYFTSINGEARNGLACIDSMGNLLDCWAGGGLGRYCINSWSETNEWLPSGGGLHGLKCFDNGDCYIFGAFKGITDHQGHHPEQVMISRISFTSVGINENENDLRPLRIWPNPSTDILHVEWRENEDFTLEIHDLQNRLIHAKTHLTGPYTVEVPHFANGLYLVTVTGRSGMRSTHKWIKR